MIDPRLQDALSSASENPTESTLIGLVKESDSAPSGAGYTGTDAAGVSALNRSNSTIDAALRAQMQAQVPGRDRAPAGPHYSVGEWLSGTSETPPVSATSSWFTVSHWHWLAAKGMVRQIPADLGPTFPYLFTSEAQIIHDLTEWSALNGRGEITAEAAAMFGAVSGDAEITLYGTVLLYAHRREPIELPAELKELGLDAAVRNVPRVTFAIGLTDREVVTALVNNATVVFSRRHRRGEIVADAAAALRELLDPRGDWAPFPMTGPVTIPAETVSELATGQDTAGVIDDEPGEDATDEERTADTTRRKRVDKAVRTTLQRARIPSGAAGDIAAIATATTDAMAQVTMRTRSVDVPRGEPAALALAFLRRRGVVVSYPSGSGANRHITYVSGTPSGIASGIEALRRVVTGR